VIKLSIPLFRKPEVEPTEGTVVLHEDLVHVLCEFTMADRGAARLADMNDSIITDIGCGGGTVCFDGYVPGWVSAFCGPAIRDRVEDGRYSVFGKPLS